MTELTTVWRVEWVDDDGCQQARFFATEDDARAFWFMKPPVRFHARVYTQHRLSDLWARATKEGE